jgi:hypothetical protein
MKTKKYHTVSSSNSKIRDNIDTTYTQIHDTYTQIHDTYTQIHDTYTQIHDHSISLIGSGTSIKGAA